MDGVPEHGTGIETAMGGVLTVAINYGNPTLADRDARGRPAGASIDLARRIANALRLECQGVTSNAARDSAAAVGAGVRDLGFFAADMDSSPKRLRATVLKGPTSWRPKPNNENKASEEENRCKP